MSKFEQYLNEMPLPKSMADDALTPEAGKYSSEKAENALSRTGVRLAEGSSRVAFRIGVEPSQFKQGIGDLELLHDLADTVIKLALNTRGIAQNEEEIKVYKKFKKLKCLLPIIDTSKNHAVNISIQQPDGKKLKTTSNWIQMPYADQPSLKEFSDIFNSWFGNWSEAFSILDNREIVSRSFQLLRQPYYKLEQLSDPSVKEFVSDEQFNHVQELITLRDAGLLLVDLASTDNWGVFKGRPVILDYGFTSKTKGLYAYTHYALASVEKDGSIKLSYKKSTGSE